MKPRRLSQKPTLLTSVPASINQTSDSDSADSKVYLQQHNLFLADVFALCDVKGFLLSKDLFHDDVSGIH